MLNAELADLLQEYRRAKANAKAARLEMLRFAVEDLGMAQDDANSMDIAAFLDGYLVGKGVFQKWRDFRDAMNDLSKNE